MAKNIEVETYRFVGDSSVNQVKFIQNGQHLGTYTQTQIIESLSKNSKHIQGGIKLKTKENDPRQGYIIYYGSDKNQPKQFIKIIFDKKNLEIGDPNALAIENLCKNSVSIKNNKILKFVVKGVSVALVTGAVIGALAVGLKKENKLQEHDAQQYQQFLHEQRMEEGTYSDWLEENGIEFNLDENEIESSRSR